MSSVATLSRGGTEFPELEKVFIQMTELNAKRLAAISLLDHVRGVDGTARSTENVLARELDAYVSAIERAIHNK